MNWNPVPPYDPELAPMLQTALSNGRWPTVIPDVIQALRDEVKPWVPPIEEVVAGRRIAHSEYTVPGPSGAPDVTLCVFGPTDPVAQEPAIFYMHGGGMVLGDRHEDVELYLDLVEERALTLVSVEYRLAPENPDPAPVEDCYAGLVWTAEHAAELGIDPARLMVAGVSAGGGLAAGVALMARDRGGPLLAAQLLNAPMLDDHNETVSSRQYESAGAWNRTSVATGWDALLGEGHSDRQVSPYAAPSRAADLSGLPTAYLDVGSAEVFRDEAVDYATRIWATGGQAELHVWAGGFHAFGLACPDAPISVTAQAVLLGWIRRVLALRPEA